MTTLTCEQVEQILDAAGEPASAVRADYSGRGMYGDKCLGFRVNGGAAFLSLAVAVSKVGGQDMVDDAREDDMGLGRIIYFPSYTCPDWPTT